MLQNPPPPPKPPPPQSRQQGDPGTDVGARRRPNRKSRDILRESCCVGRVGRGASFGHFLYFRACPCLAKRNHLLLHSTSQFVYRLLQTTHVFSKHAVHDAVVVCVVEPFATWECFFWARFPPFREHSMGAGLGDNSPACGARGARAWQTFPLWVLKCEYPLCPASSSVRLFWKLDRKRTLSRQLELRTPVWSAAAFERGMAGWEPGGAAHPVPPKRRQGGNLGRRRGGRNQSKPFVRGILGHKKSKQSRVGGGVSPPWSKKSRRAALNGRPEPGFASAPPPVGARYRPTPSLDPRPPSGLAGHHYDPARPAAQPVIVSTLRTQDPTDPPPLARAHAIGGCM